MTSYDFKLLSKSLSNRTVSMDYAIVTTYIEGNDKNVVRVDKHRFWWFPRARIANFAY